MRLTFFLFLFLTAKSLSFSQAASFNFRRVTIKDGMSDGVVSTIAQDKYGFMWFGGTAGLNRYDGYRVTNFIYNAQDSFSVPAEFVYTMLCDRSGTMWFGYSNGLYRFDYVAKRFELMPSTKGTTINEIRQGDGNSLCLFTGKGLAFYNISADSISFCTSLNEGVLENKPIYEGWMHQSLVYIASRMGVVVYNSITNDTKILPLKSGETLAAWKVVVDSSGTIWASNNANGGMLYKRKIADTSFEEISSHRYSKTGAYEVIKDLYVDQKNRLWVGTIWSGLISINTTDNNFTTFENDRRVANSIPENHVNKVYMDKLGFLWIGTEGTGAAYFQPDYNLFKVFFPESMRQLRPHIWCRAIAEDAAGNIWMGTGTGLVKQPADRRESTLFYQNEITGKEQVHNNSIRSLICDNANNIWIGTAAGVNMYETATGKMHFYDEKDSLPKSFYWSILQDSKKIIWFGSTAALYYKLPGENKFYSLNHHPVLKAYADIGVRSLYEDSRGNLWIGLNGKGLIFYDTKNQSAKYWSDLGSSSNPLGRVITSVTEDKKGILWFSSYYGIASYNYRTNEFTPYADLKVMESLQISALQVDDEDRLWLASARGLLMLDKQRRVFKRFNVEDGLPDIQFSDQIAYKLRNGQFVYPTYDGFVSFDPLQYREKNISGNTVISSMTIAGEGIVRSIDLTDLKELNLTPSENFFTIELTAFNYSNPKETWYAYQLDGFDKSWTYTKNRSINYTNVPGGHYVFRYKASSDPNQWNVDERNIKIYVATVFYKAWWFRILLFTLLLAGIFGIYRYRLRQSELLTHLEKRAQLLEREKTQVQYDNLKQQLNPHFLFNSLTSLSSLINVDPKTAGKFLDSLSKTYRYILKNSNSEKVPLMNELKFAESYINLQQTRFEKGLFVNINVPEECHYRLIVPVTLQNMIENAIKHNIIDAESPLVIDIYTEDDNIIIRNNLQRKNFVETSNKQGLESLKSLYHYLSSRPVEIREDENYFSIKIPLL